MVCKKTNEIDADARRCNKTTSLTKLKRSSVRKMGWLLEVDPPLFQLHRIGVGQSALESGGDLRHPFDKLS